MNWIIDCCTYEVRTVEDVLVSKEGAGISNLNEFAPLNEASDWEGANCLTSVARGTGAKLKTGC